MAGPGAPSSPPGATSERGKGMIKAVDIKAELSGRPVLGARGKDTPEAEAREAFAVLAPFRDGSIFAGSFSGESPWERHQKGDELVHILDGATTLTIMTDDGPRSFEMTRCCGCSGTMVASRDDERGSLPVQASHQAWPGHRCRQAKRRSSPG